MQRFSVGIARTVTQAATVVVEAENSEAAEAEAIRRAYNNDNVEWEVTEQSIVDVIEIEPTN